MTPVAGSCSHHHSRSLVLTSAWLPTETKVDTPTSSAVARSSRAIPKPPDWDRKPIGPGRGGVGANVALSRTAGSVLTTPMPVSYTHLRAHETPEQLVCRLLLEKKIKTT